MKTWVLSFLFLVLGRPLLADDTPLDPGQLLFQAFKCQSNGPFSSRALADTQALEGILIQIKQDKNCDGLTGLMTSLISAQNQFQFFNQGFNGEEKRNLEAYEKRLTVALALSANPAEADLLTQEIAEVHLKIEQLPVEDAHLQREERAKAMALVSTYLEAVNSSYANQLNCFNKHQALPIQIAGQLLSVAGGFFDPTVHVAVSLITRLFQTFFDFLSNVKINKQISDYRKTTMRVGLTCAMEALEQTVCDIQDHQQLVEKLTRFKFQDQIPAAWKGYDLLQRDYPILRKFLTIVEAGPAPSTVEQGNRRGNFFAKQGSNRFIEQSVLGQIAQADRDMGGLSNEMDKRIVIKNLVVNISNIVAFSGGGFSEVLPGSSNAGDPTGNSKVYSAELWFRLNEKNPNLESAKSYAELVTRMDGPNNPYKEKDAVVKLDTKLVLEAFTNMAAAASRLLENEKSQTVNTDQDVALTSWTFETQVAPSAGMVLQKIIDYLKDLEAAWNEHKHDWFDMPEAWRDQMKILSDTRSRFETTLTTIKNDQMTVGQKLEAIYQAMQLKDRDQISIRFRFIVEQDLVKRLRAGLLGQDAEILDTFVRLSTQSLLEALSPDGSVGNTQVRLMRARPDLQQAELTAYENLTHFYEHYGEYVVGVLEQVSELCGPECMNLEKDDPLWNEFSKICILALNNPKLENDDWSNRNIRKLCTGRSLKLMRDLEADEPAIDPYGKPLEVFFAKEMMKGPKSRMCVYRRYQNKAELYEVLRQRPSAFFQNFVNERPEFDKR